MRLRYVTLLAMATAAATIGLVPVAAAAPTGSINQCTGTGNATVCARPGNAQIISSPPVVSRPLYPLLPYPLSGVILDHGRLR